METLLALLAAGMTIEEMLADYPDLEREDLLADLEFDSLTTPRTTDFERQYTSRRSAGGTTAAGDRGRVKGQEAEVPALGSL